MLDLTTPLRNGMLVTGSLKSLLDSGFLYIFTGPVPASAEDALDMASAHTQLVKLTESNDGATGLTFDAIATNGVLAKDPDEVWEGTIAFDGADDAETTLEATFYRFCEAGDDARGSGVAKKRIQGTIGANAAFDMTLTDPSLTANGANTQSLAIVNFELP